MEGWNQEATSSDSGVAGMNSVSLDPNNNTDSNDTINLSTTTAFLNNDLEASEFHSHSESKFRSFLRYIRSALVLVTKILLELFHANNDGFLSKLLRIFATGFLYAMVYTSTTGTLLWAFAYFMDHSLYLLAVASAMVLLLLCFALLVVYEWMWLWQKKAISLLCRTSDGYNRLRSVTVLEDDEMEDELTLRGWIRLFARILASCLVWFAFCFLNVKADFWLTEKYPLAQHYGIVLRLVNCFVAAPILLGAAFFLYAAYPSSYRWNFEAYAGQTFASTEDIDNEGYTIPVDDDLDDNERAMGMGMQNLII